MFLELGNAVGFLLGPLLVPNPPEKHRLHQHNYTSHNMTLWLNESYNLVKQIDEHHLMKEDIMLLMYTRKKLI